ncbi:MAG: flotillin-like FloA family protein, partial [Gemmatimonadales bacterium]
MDQSVVSLGVILALLFIGVIVLIIFFQFIPIGLWIRAVASGVRVSFLTLFGMRFRKVNPAAIVDPLITARKAGLDLTIDELEIHFLSGGHVQRVVNALISADKAQIPLTFKQATAIDLAGRDVFEA